jgi:1,4-dihydroxy-2-naphthoate octaprenyltransferase
MEQDGTSAPNSAARIAPVEGHSTPDPAPPPPPAKKDDVQVDPMEFFQPATSHEDIAAFAKAQARRKVASNALVAFARAARVNTLPWAIAPIAVAAVFLWSAHQPLSARHLLELAFGAGVALMGVNLLRAAARALGPHASTGIITSTYAQLGAGLLALGALPGYLAAHNAGGHAVALGLGGLALAAAYALVGIFLGALPGEEIMPAVALGPMLFALTLASQAVTVAHKVGDTTVLVTGATGIPAKTTTFVALALGLLVLAVILAGHLGRTESGRGFSTQRLIGIGGMRAAFALSLVLAYGGVLIATFGRGLPHAPAAVLLSLPAALVPLTGALRATTPKALAVLLPQTRRAFLWFNAWLIGGVILGVIYLRIAAALHSALGK